MFTFVDENIFKKETFLGKKSANMYDFLYLKQRRGQKCISTWNARSNTMSVYIKESIESKNLDLPEKCLKSTTNSHMVGLDHYKLSGGEAVRLKSKTCVDAEDQTLKSF